jgi:tetratricopeptide (TPR) repeat protein/predicted Ser/Thr protein kinase
MAQPPEGIQCPQCRHSNPSGSVRCVHCSTSFADSNETIAIDEGWSRAMTGGFGPLGMGSFVPGDVIADRYEVIELIGEGGMGTVYKARDREVDRVVALKVIRPDLAGQAKILERFKQELILARQVTHKNVIRIFDLGSAGSLKFITMEFVEGRDLSHLLRERKFTVEESIRIIRQVCRALDAAHAESVVHRDLKPQNIMMNDSGKVCVMDFGLAFSTDMNSLTQTGTLMGTPAYMSPEQAQGKTLDARSDIYALGIIFYEMLTGDIPFRADSMIASLLKRSQGPPPDPASVNPAIPKEVSAVVLKCLAVDPDNRYPSTTEVLRELDVLAGDSVAASAMQTPAEPIAQKRTWKWVSAALGASLAVVLIVGFILRDKIISHAPAHAKPVTLLVADFQNATGDPIFENTLESMFNIAMEGAAFVNAYNRGQARKIAAQLRPNAKTLDEPLARLVSLREGIAVIVEGSIARHGSGYQISVKAIDAASGKPIANRQAKAGSREAVLSAIPKLAAPIRKALGDITPESAQVAAAETYTTSSLEAGHLYAMAQEAMWAGKRADAIRDYTHVVEIDPKFGRAYAGLAVTYGNQKKYAEAAEYYKKALALLDRMTERERYRTLATYYLSSVRNYTQAIETLRKLVSLYPADSAAYNNLSIAYAYVRNLPEAVAASRHALEVNPTNVQAQLNYAVYSMLAGNFDASVAESDQILKRNPGYEFAFLPLALSTLAKGNVQGSLEIYARLSKVSPSGASLAAAGQGDLEMFLGRYKEALTVLQTGIDADTKEKNTGELAVKQLARAEAYLAMGQRAQAIQAAAEAADLSPVESIDYLGARVLLQAGDEAKARALADKLQNMLQTQTQSYARLIAGEIALQHGRTLEAVDAFRDGQKLLDSWISRFLLGRAYVEAGHYAEALTEFDICRKRSGEAADLFFADMTTLRYLPPLYYWLGRAQEGLGSKEAARTSYQEFLKLRADADPGAPLVADARKRM